MATRENERPDPDYPGEKNPATRGKPSRPGWAAEESERAVARIALTRHAMATQLPTLDEEMLGGDGSVEMLAAQLEKVLQPIRGYSPSALATMPTQQARELLHVLGFAACAVEYFAQEAGRPRGAGVQMIAGLEDQMAALSISAELPPNLGMHGFWLANPDAEPLRFTKNPGESFFRAGVVKINYLQERSASMLAPIADGAVPLTAADAAAAITGAAELQQLVHDVYAAFRDDKNITVEFFRTVMRRFLVAFPVHGTEFHSANAANICSQATLDFIVGTTESFYISHVAERMRYMTPEERDVLHAAMGAPSLLDRILDELGTDADEVRRTQGGELPELIMKRPDLLATLLAFRQLERAAGGAAGAHYGLIVKFLVKPDMGEGPSSVKASHGTGGRSHEETKAVAAMRNRHPVARPLSDAIAAVCNQLDSKAA